MDEQEQDQGTSQRSDRKAPRPREVAQKPTPPAPFRFTDWASI